MALSGTGVAGRRRTQVDRYDALATVLVAGLVIGGGWLALSTTLNHDSAWYLHATKQFLAGARLYEDIVEVNPPLAFYLTVPPVWLAEATGVFAVDLFFLWVFALCGASLLLTRQVLALSPDLPASARRALLIAVALTLILCAWRQIGQREHLLLIFAMPYLCLAAVRATGAGVNRWLAIAVGLSAALGFGLKPYFLLVPAVAELYLMRTLRRPLGLFRPETWSLGAALVIYAMSVFVFTPEYLTRVVPLAGEVYYAYVGPIFGVLFRAETFLLLVVLALYRPLRPTTPMRPFADVFVLAAVAFYVIYLVQMKGWSYHRIPVSAALFVTLVCLLFGAFERARRTGIVLVSLVLTLTAGFLVLNGSYKNRFFERALPIVQEQAPAAGSSMSVLSTNVWQGFPLATYAGLEWASRFPTLWHLPGAIRNRQDLLGGGAAESATFGAIERFVVDAVIEDLEKRSPTFVIVDERADKSYFGGHPFDYIAYFSRDPRFDALWERYERFDDLDGFRFYRLRCAAGGC